MEGPSQKKRRPNFSDEEMALIEAVAKRKNVVLGKLDNRITGQVKNNAWECVTREVNLVARVPRTVAEVRWKFTDLRAAVKKKAAQEKKHMGGTAKAVTRDLRQCPWRGLSATRATFLSVRHSWEAPLLPQPLAVSYISLLAPRRREREGDPPALHRQEGEGAQGPVDALQGAHHELKSHRSEHEDAEPVLNLGAHRIIHHAPRERQARRIDRMRLALLGFPRPTPWRRRNMSRCSCDLTQSLSDRDPAYLSPSFLQVRMRLSQALFLNLNSNWRDSKASLVRDTGRRLLFRLSLLLSRILYSSLIGSFENPNLFLYVDFLQVRMRLSQALFLNLNSNWRDSKASLVRDTGRRLLFRLSLLLSRILYSSLIGSFENPNLFLVSSSPDRDISYVPSG
ncbi:hypothetical protein C7M84_001110 [Penaeus vannamei]|uniref:Regulatory protein zeste n=1 Tax=Penaeus vannamei TaxID=6689 RepID=A0A3R7SXM5_PENVA|nr:hypothetical protein C7M84_001110 [Penaeus vannamei]